MAKAWVSVQYRDKCRMRNPENSQDLEVESIYNSLIASQVHPLESSVGCRNTWWAVHSLLSWYQPGKNTPFWFHETEPVKVPEGAGDPIFLGLEVFSAPDIIVLFSSEGLSRDLKTQGGCSHSGHVDAESHEGLVAAHMLDEVFRSDAYPTLHPLQEKVFPKE